jgi:hypothetical protein
MSASVTVLACVLAVGLFAMALGVHADRGQIVDEATGTKFDELTRIDSTSYACLGAGVRKLAFVNVYALAFYVNAAHADEAVKSYLQAHHRGLRGQPLFEALRKDVKFFDMLATTEHSRLVVLKMQRDLSRRQLASNIRRSLSPLLPEDKLDRLDAAITKGAVKGQVVKIYAVGSKLTVDVAGEVRTVEDEEVVRHLYSVWLGPESVSPTLREDIARRVARLRP